MSGSTMRVRAEAANLLNGLWRRRCQVWDPVPLNPSDIFPLDVRLVVELGLGVRFEEPEEVPVAAVVPAGSVPVQTAGFIDRERHRVVVARKFQADYRRFTAAHEVGHWVLHPEFKYHRDRPLKGGERLSASRSVEEREADAFAAELLMPGNYVRRFYVERFLNAIHASALDENVVFWLADSRPSGGHSPNFASLGRRYWALRAATCSAFNGHNFEPLTRRFGVSPTAVAIRLEELGLVRS